MAQSLADSCSNRPIKGYDSTQRLEASRRSDRQRDQLMEDLVTAYHTLVANLQETSSNLANEQQSRREGQRQAQHAPESVNRSQHLQGAAPFTLVLIDGDGAPFLDDLYSRDAEGGKEAAYRLTTELRKQIAASHPSENTAHWDIVINVFVNMDGLTKKLRACGLLPHGADISAFAQSFSRQLLQFVDVGFGKERADYKLRDWFRLFINNVQCKHIVLGGICHDNGYLPMLDPYLHDPAQHTRISFLATLPPQPAYKNMHFRSIRVNDVFRSRHLPSKPIASPPGLSHSNDTNTELPLPIVNRTTRPKSAGFDLPARTKKHKVNSVTSSLAPPSAAATNNRSITSASSAASEGTAINASWATVSRPAADQPPTGLQIAVDKAGQDRLYRRNKENDKVCNEYHLTGKCPGKCGFYHGEKLTGTELGALRFRARTRPCPDGTGCEKIDCTMGHVCPYGDYCYGNSCAFDATHKMDLVPKYKYYKDGTTKELS